MQKNQAILILELSPQIEGRCEVKPQNRTRLRLFRAHGLIKKVPKTNRYVLTKKGCKVTTTVLAASNVDIEQLMDMVI